MFFASVNNKETVLACRDATGLVIHTATGQWPDENRPPGKAFDGLRCIAVMARCSLRSHPRLRTSCPTLGRNPTPGLA